MSKRSDILSQLKEELGLVINPSNSPYKSSISEVKQGVFKWDVITNKPCVCFSLEKDIVDEEQYGSNQLRTLTICLYVYMDSNEYEDYTDIYLLLHDLEYFFKYDFTYKDSSYVKDIGIIEGGASAPCSYIDMDIDIKYMQEI